MLGGYELLSTHFVGDRELCSALGTTTRENLAPVLGTHTLTETVLVSSLAT